MIIDKALLACLLVIELLDLRQACGKLGNRRQFPSAQTAVSGTAQERPSSADKSQEEKSSVKGNTKPRGGTNGNKKITLMNSPKGAVSPRREKLTSLKQTKTELEKEINEMHEDTTKLETELFSTIEEKTKVEEELFGMKHQVTKLRSELFHLKLEKSNLEKDVKKSKSQDNLQQCQDTDEPKLNVESPKEALRGYPELSDVMEASHESNDSENSSQMSDGNDNREAFLKTCMENISKIYSFIPNPDEIASEDELSDDQEPTLSDANIDDSDEEIIITKLARSLRSPNTSPAKEKSFEATSPNKSAKKEDFSGLKAHMGNENGDDLGSKSKEALIKQIQELKRKLHKVEQQLAEAQETSEDLEDELDHKKGQLAEAQETITNLENQVGEEKETCEQVRHEYFNVKNQNEILEEKIKAIRAELERVLVRENNIHTESAKKDHPPPSPTKTSEKSPLKSPGKSKASKIDLRIPPPKLITSNEMEVVGLIEENAELKVKFEKATQEKARLEKSQKLVEDKATKTKAALQASEDSCSRLMNDLAVLTKEKIKLTEEITDLRNNNSRIAEELQRYREKSTRLEKDIEAIAYMSTRLEKDNKTLEMEISKMESELSSWKTKHEAVTQELQSLNQERIQLEKEYQKALHGIDDLRKEKNQLLEQRFSNDKENKRRDEDLRSKEERFFELESEVSEQKRLNSNLHKELAGMAEYQEALEKEYSKAKNEEGRLKQALAKASSRAVEVETELAIVTQNSHDEAVLKKAVKTFKGTPSKKFYTITHTSEDEIGDTSSSIAESPADESKQVEHDNQLLKLENGYLQQQLAESEHVLAMYRQDLESAHDLIDKLRGEIKVKDVDAKNTVVEEDCKSPSDKDDTIKEIGDCLENASDEYKLLEEKHAELTREYELLRVQYQDALTDKEKVSSGKTKENKHLNQGSVTEDKIDEKVSNSRQAVSHLQERIQQLEIEKSQLKKTSDELTQNAETAKNALLKSLEDEKRVKLTLEEKINKLESEKEMLRKKSEVTAMHKGRKFVRRLSLDDELTNMKDENEALKTQMPKCTVTSHSHPVQLQQTSKEHDSGKITGDYEVKMRKLEEDLLKVTSEKLKLEFELRTAKSDCERLRSDLDHSESERTLLNTQLDDNIEKAANLEIRLMEMRCSCETIKDEINTLKNEKRQESFHLHEASVCKEILEKRLEDALKENNVFRHDLDTLREERKENEKKSAKLEKDKDQLTKEIEDVKTQIRRLEQDFEENQDRAVETGEVQDDTTRKENHHVENVSEYQKLHEQDQEQLKILQEEVQKLTAQHDQMRIELEETKGVKANLEKQLDDTKNNTEESCGKTGPATQEETISVQNENIPECERTTFDTLEIEKHTRLLEKEKGFLEKELTRVQEECNNLKDKLEVIKHVSENAQTQEASRTELEDKQEQLEKELQELRELNQKLESECDDSYKLINQLEIKTKALESLQKELRCFHEENDRLTHEVDIIHHTSKAMSDHQRTKESLERENCSLKQELESVKHSNRKLQLQTEDLSKELAAFKDKSQSVSSTKKLSASLQSEVEKLQKMQQHLEGELASTREKTKELENANESLKKENKAVKGRIKSLEQRNEELRRKDDKKKASIVENKLKGKPKQGQNVLKESKVIQTEESNSVKEKEKYLQDTVGQLENEKIQLEKQLNNLREKVNGECAAVQIAPGITIATQKTELPPEEKSVKTMEASCSTTIDQDQEINMERKREDESAPLEEDLKTGFSIMAKEKLLLERKAAHFNRAQMQLEQSFAKAMRENAALKMKVDEAENVLGVLREKLYELEKKNSTFLPIADLKQNVVLSSDSESDSEEEVAATSATKEVQKDNKDIGYPSNAKESTISSSSSDDNCHSIPTQHKSEHLRNDKEQPLKDMTSQKEEVDSPQSTDVSAASHKQTKSDTNDYLKSGKAHSEREWKLIKRNVDAPEETEKGEQLSINDVSSGLLPTISEVDQPRNEKEQPVQEVKGDQSDKSEIESGIKQPRDGHGLINESQKELQPLATTNMSTPTQSEIYQLGIEKEKLLKELEGLRSQMLEHESELKRKKDNLEISNDDTERLFAKHEEITLLKQERKTLLEELEEARNKRNLTESELRHNKESCLKQEQEIKLLLSSYTQEKESLLRELENTKSDCRQAKEKIRELQRIESEFEDIQKKSKEAEKLIIELEKDLLSQTEMKNELRRELQTCKSKLQEIEQLETQLRTCRTENEDLLQTNTHLMEEIRKWKDEPDFKTTRLQSQKLEKQRISLLNVNPSMKRLVSDKHVQTELAIEYYVDRYEKRSEENAPPNLQDSFNTDLRQENKTDDVPRTPDDSEARTEFHKTNKYETIEPPVKPEQTESAQTIHKDGEVEVMTTIRREGTLGGVNIPIIIVSHVDEAETIIQKDRAASLSLYIEDFERDSPNDQSTPDQETRAIEPSIDNENKKNIHISGQKEKVPLATTEGIENVHQPSQKALGVQLSQEAGVENPNLEAKNHQNLHLESPVHLATEIGPVKRIFNSDMEARLIDIEEDVLKSRRELEWTISRLKSELLQRSEENEKSQHEISSLVEEQLSMKREISSLLNECESLRGKAAILQTQNEAVLKEQILNDEENEELQQNLQDLLKERNSIEEAKRNLESQKARLEIELSDAIETREAMERELLRIRSEDRDVSRQRLEQQLHDTSERYAKLETVLSCVLDENSKMNAEISILQAENSMLKSFKIMEITDNCTQISPHNTEDEGDGKEKQLVSSGNSTPRHPLSLGEEDDCDNSVSRGQAQDDDRINKDELSVTPVPSNPSSTDLTVSPVVNAFDEGTKTKRGRVISTDHGNAKERQKAGRVGTPLSCAGSMANKQQRKHQRNHSRDNSSLHQRSAPEEASRRDSDDNDSSMEVHTDSSLVSATDLDMSISSDQISSEDSSVVGTEIRVLQRMQKELAEAKCSNVLIKNELSIVRKHNSDLQNQVQKLLSRNNHLKTKMCDRTLSVKRMEKEMSSIREENNRLQQQALVLQEEMARLDKDKAKFERNVSSTKSENKRLKSDLSNIKAESYRTMKELVSLQSENRRLQLEIERFKDEERSFKSGFSDESISQELSLWGSMSHGDFRSTSRRSLQERPVKPEPAYFQQRAASDLNFSPHQRQAESLETAVSIRP